MNNIKTLKKFISVCFKISPSYIFLLLLQSLTETGQILINVILPKFLVDELVGGRNKDNLIRYGMLIVLSNVLFFFLNKLMKRILEVRNIYMKEKLNQAMADKIMKVEFACLEDITGTYNRNSCCYAEFLLEIPVKILSGAYSYQQKIWLLYGLVLY